MPVSRFKKAVRRFRKLCERSGLRKEMRRKAYYEKPSSAEAPRRIEVLMQGSPAHDLPGLTTSDSVNGQTRWSGFISFQTRTAVSSSGFAPIGIPPANRLDDRCDELINLPRRAADIATWIEDSLKIQTGECRVVRATGRVGRFPGRAIFQLLRRRHRVHPDALMAGLGGRRRLERPPSSKFSVAMKGSSKET